MEFMLLLPALFEDKVFVCHRPEYLAAGGIDEELLAPFIRFAEDDTGFGATG